MAKVTRPAPHRPAWLYPVGTVLMLRDGRRFMVNRAVTRYESDPVYWRGVTPSYDYYSRRIWIQTDQKEVEE